MIIQTNISLSHLNTLGLQSQAKYYTEIHELQELSELLREESVKDKKWHILGGGSNLVIPHIVDGLVIKMANKGMQLTRQDDEFWYVKASAGEVWDDFIQWTLSNSYFGLENLSLIPGTVGAAPIQNIGAYGVEIKDLLWEVTAINLLSGLPEVFKNSDCHFSYRESFFKQAGAGKYIIWDVTFRLPKKNKMHLEYGDISKELQKQNLEINPQNISKAVIKIRQSKLPDPKIIGNVGSFFKNPLVTKEVAEALLLKHPNLVYYAAGDKFKIAAGWLIDQSGWKGKQLGPVGMYEKQALVLVNHGLATADDVWALSNQVRGDVKKQFGIDIEPEPIQW